MTKETPSLFGLINSNRDFLQDDTWGKNQFNSSFPASLLCYMASKGQGAKYIVSTQSKIQVDEIEFKTVVGLDWNSKDLFFSFESEFSPYHKYVSGKLPRVDLVFQNLKNSSLLAPLEIKLTALPDNTTCELAEEKYGSELVIRPDTIVYLALSLLHNQAYKPDQIKGLVKKHKINSLDFEDEKLLVQRFSSLLDFVSELVSISEQKQSPLIMQPIWKTMGKAPRLAENCLDCFIWSDVGFLKFNAEICKITAKTNSINRQMRSIVWLVKMLLDYFENGHFSPEHITNQLVYGVRNDKAFAASGFVTNYYMSCAELTKPRITKNEIKNIIKGGGEKLLSPERRFDAIVFSSPDLF